MSGRLCVLLDANIIIVAHERGLWEKLTQRLTLVIPTTVKAEAAFFLDPDTQQQEQIHLEQAIQQGIIREIDIPLDRVVALLDRFTSDFLDQMDPGEAQAIAMLADGMLPDHLFCTGDGPAIKALAMLDMSSTGISLERLLNDLGMKLGSRRQLPRTTPSTSFKNRYAKASLRDSQEVAKT